jgi:hypothetical protein
MTELRKAIVELLACYSADDVLAEVRRVLDDTHIPLPLINWETRVSLSSGIDGLLRDNE